MTPAQATQLQGLLKKTSSRYSEVTTEDPQSIYNQIEAYTSLFRCTIYNIIHEILKLRKAVASQELSDEVRRKLVEGCLENLKLLREGKWRLCVVVTGYRSCFFY